MDIISQGRARILRGVRLSLRKHTTSLHDPWREFYEYRRALAFLERSVRYWRERGRAGNFWWRDALFVGGWRGGRAGLGS